MGRFQVVYLDTHVVIRLFTGQTERLSKEARRAIDSPSLLISAAVIYELEILYELRRSQVRAGAVASALRREIGLEICRLPFADIVEHAVTEAWTRDPMDRLIVANAKAARAPLVTADEKIRDHYTRAIW